MNKRTKERIFCLS